MFREHKNKIPVYIIAAIAAIITYLLSSNYNLGFSPDSVTYFETANSLISGKGFTDLNGHFVNHWPPGYPFFIMIISWAIGIPTILAGTIGNVFIVFSTILILFEIFDSYKIPPPISYFLLFLFILSPFFSIYLWFLSEGLFIFLFLLSLLIFTKWKSSHSVLYLSLSALILGISALVRYAGIGFFIGYLVYLLLNGNYKFIKTTISNLFVFIISFLLPLVPWLFYARLNGKASHDRKFDFEIIPATKFQEILLSIGSWIFGNLYGLFFLSFSILVLAVLYKSKLKFSVVLKLNLYLENKWRLPLILGIMYLLFILFSASFLDHAIPLSNRIFSPVYPFFLLLFGSLLTYLHNKVSFKLAYILPFLVMISYSFRNIPIYIHHYKEGSGFTSQKFQNSALLNYVQKNLEDKTLYTNDLFLLKIFTKNQNIIQLPVTGNSSGLEKIKPQLRKRQVVIIYFELIDWRNYMVGKKEILKTFDNVEIRRFKDGFVLLNN
ncbi:hypothetical protein [Christiangramia flava]|uniref:hypothetical protein n=1 Tax=Christiangramia flava TaxID=1486245 RepID=UPI0009FAE96B|nr:hypothetical protein [Christiangramia flava]